jgi:hypothetical protein
MHPITVTGLALSVACLLAATAHLAAEDLVVHEWGTFTSLQNGRGETLGDLNVDEEALPGFVHDAMPGLLHPDLALTPNMHFDKGVIVDGHAVTMRLETPVIYFHQPAGAQPASATVEVSFQGGVLSQFFPAAQLRTAGVVDERGHFIVDPLTSASRSTLTWRYVQIGHGQKEPASVGPATTAPVWLAPRAVAAADLHAGAAGEGENFLFYRGLGHRDAPVRVVRDADQERFTVFPRPAGTVGGLAVPAWWVVDIREDGATAFRELPAATIGSDPQVAGTSFSGEFAAADHSTGNRAALIARMHAALVGDGLFADEATALLDTWATSYFSSPGLRLFFLVPRPWTDAVLPLRITGYTGAPLPATLVRTMVGRIELVSQRQRDLLAAIAAQPGQQRNLAWWQAALEHRFGGLATVAPQNERDLLRAMLRDPGTIPGVVMPADFSAFLALGRFRQALVRDAVHTPALAGLKAFMAAYAIE